MSDHKGWIDNERDHYFWLDLAIIVFIILPSIAIALNFAKCIP